MSFWRGPALSCLVFFIRVGFFLLAGFFFFSRVCFFFFQLGQFFFRPCFFFVGVFFFFPAGSGFFSAGFRFFFQPGQVFFFSRVFFFLPGLFFSAGLVFLNRVSFFFSAGIRFVFQRTQTGMMWRLAHATCPDMPERRVLSGCRVDKKAKTEQQTDQEEQGGLDSPSCHAGSRRFRSSSCRMQDLVRRRNFRDGGAVARRDEKSITGFLEDLRSQARAVMFEPR